MGHHSSDLSATSKDLENKCLDISDGLRPNFRNKNVLKTLFSGINLDYDSLMAECIFLSGEDRLPDTQTEKSSVEQAKLELFVHARIKSWYENVALPPIGTRRLHPPLEPRSKESS